MIFQNSLGIDISQHRLGLLCLKNSFKGIINAKEAVYLLEKGKSLKEKLDAAADLVKAFIESHQIASGDIFIGIPNESAMIREIRLPLAAKENLRETLIYEMEKFVPIPADEIYFDYQILAEDKEHQDLRILLAIAKKSVIDPYLELKEKLGSAISGIEIRSSAIANFLSYRLSDSKDVSVAYERLIDLQKNSAVEISASSEELGVSEDLIPAFGLALKGLYHTPIQMNFIPPELRKKRGKTGIYTLFILLCLMILFGAGWGASRVIHHRLIENRINQEMKRVVAEVNQADHLRAEVEALEKKADYLNKLQNGRPTALDMMAELSRIIPDKAWVQQLMISEKGLQLEGYADAASELIPILDASPMFKDVAFLSSITKERDGKERFSIGLKTKS
jgi:Tfp pilus assembly protein PilN